MAISVSFTDRLLSPIHRWVWSEPSRKGHKLLQFALTEADGGRDIARAAELTADPLLRRLYLVHAHDELRHARLFRERGAAVLASVPEGEAPAFMAASFAPGERGLDDLRVEAGDSALLAFMHLSERDAAQRFAVYTEVLDSDPATREVFAEILRDEAFHMNYTRAQLVRIAPQLAGRELLSARLSRLWKGYLRVAAAIASVLGGVMLTLQYFVIVPVFALLVRQRAPRTGWQPPSISPGDAAY